MTKIEALQEKRKSAAVAARQILDKVTDEKRKMTDEERANYSTAFNEARDLKQQIEDEQQLQEVEADLERSIEGPTKPDVETGSDGLDQDQRAQDTANTLLFRSFLRGGKDALSPDQYRDLRAQQADDDKKGGAIVTPLTMVARLLKKLDDLVFIRSLATVDQVSQAASLGMGSLEADFADCEWTPECKVADEDELEFGDRILRPYELTKLAKISYKLMQIASRNPEDIVVDRLAYRFAVTEEKAFMLGDGNEKPLGLFFPSEDGVPTSRDVSEGFTTTTLEYAGLVKVYYSLKAAYRKRAGWILPRAGVEQASLIVDENGRPLWRDGLTETEPDRLMGRPVYESEFAPDTFEADQYVGMFGDYSFYWIADLYEMVIQVLTEKYADENKIGYIGRSAVDGMPSLAEAFTRIKLASA